MPYRAPNAYARFVKTADAVNSPGATRVMGIVGTGLNYYEVYNEPITKSSIKPFDALENSNVFEILSVSSKPIFYGKNTPDNTIYERGDAKDFILKDGQFIAWKMSADPTVALAAGPTETATAFLDTTGKNVDALVDANNGHFVEDGEWIVEVTYVDETAGAYRVINNDTKETIGEYGVSATAKIGVIPGLKLTVSSTAMANVGDYVLITTTAGKTETEPSVDFDDTFVTASTDLENKIQSLMVVNKDTIETATYDFIITKAAVTTGTVAPAEFKIVKNVGETDEKTIHEGQVGAMAEYVNVIPGVAFIFSDGAGLTLSAAVRVATVGRATDAAPAESSVYYVSYKYRKAEENYGPRLFFDYDEIIEQYGNYDVTGSGVVINSLALGAEIAFANGVGSVVCVQAKNDSDYEMKLAIDKLQRALPGVSNINTIIPLTESDSVGAHTMKHVDIMSSEENGKERMVYLGAARTQLITKNASTLDKSIGMVETATAYNNERVVFVVPGEVIKDVRDLRTGRVVERKLPGCYLAVAVAALGLVNDPAEPLTNKAIAGFKQLTQTYMESEKNFLAAAGCLVLEQRGPVIRVRHGITTSTASVNSSEITLIQIKDYVIEACKKATADLYVGNKNRPSIVSDVQYTISNILNQFIGQEVIIGFNNLSVKRSKDDPRQIDVKFEIEAVYPLNYINISFGFAAVS